MFGIVVRATVICIPLMYGVVHDHIPALMAALAAVITSAKGYSPGEVAYSAAGTAALVEAAITLITLIQSR